MADLTILIQPLLIASFDFVTIARCKFLKSDNLDKIRNSTDFSILVPIFGNIKYLKNVEYLKKYSSKVVLCTTDIESMEFNNALETLARKYNFKIFRSHLQVAKRRYSKPNPWSLFNKTLKNEGVWKDAREEILADSAMSINSKYIIFIDGDTTTIEPMEKLCGIMRMKNYDLSSVRVLASKEDTLMEKLQSREYELAMDARKIYPWLTSGAGMIAKTSVMKEVMSHHSYFFSGGDIEIGKLATMRKYKVGHIPFVFYTDVPETFKSWFKQRMTWSGGTFRHAVVNLNRHQITSPFFFFYFTILIYFGAPFRIYELFKRPQSLLIVIILYWFLIYAFMWRKRKLYFLLFPFYSMIQIFLLLPIGVYTYTKMVKNSNNIGIIRLRKNDKYIRAFNKAS